MSSRGLSSDEEGKDMVRDSAALFSASRSSRESLFVVEMEQWM